MTNEDWKDRYYEQQASHREFVDMSGHEHRNALAKLERELAEARFRPMGDNHHNAVACPYCNPQRLELAPAGLVGYAERIAQAGREVVAAWDARYPEGNTVRDQAALEALRTALNESAAGRASKDGTAVGRVEGAKIGPDMNPSLSSADSGDCHSQGVQPYFVEVPRTLLEGLLEMHQDAADALVDEHGDRHRAMVERLTDLLGARNEIGAVPAGPLRDLGARLTRMLNDDDWNNIVPLLDACEAAYVTPSASVEEPRLDTLLSQFGDAIGS